jgi:hypothetical protein
MQTRVHLLHALLDREGFDLVRVLHLIEAIDVEPEARTEPELLLLTQMSTQSVATGRRRHASREWLRLHLDVCGVLGPAIESGERRLGDVCALELVRERGLQIEVRVEDLAVSRLGILAPRVLDPGQYLVRTREPELEREWIDIGNRAVLDRHVLGTDALFHERLPAPAAIQ